MFEEKATTTTAKARIFVVRININNNRIIISNINYYSTNYYTFNSNYDAPYNTSREEEDEENGLKKLR